jgi:WD40 repeat protein
MIAAESSFFVTGRILRRGWSCGAVRSPMGEWIEDLYAHLSESFGIAFSADGRRLISTSGGREAVRLWDVGTRQELLTLVGTGSELGR